MPRIPDSEFNTVQSQRVPEVAQVSTDTGTMKALGQLGGEMERLGTILVEKRAAAQFLDWQQDYTNTMMDREVKFKEMLKQSTDDEINDPDGPVQAFVNETSTIRQEKANASSNLWKANDAKRFIDNRGTFYDKKFQMMLGTERDRRATNSGIKGFQLQLDNIERKNSIGEPVDQDVKDIINLLKGDKLSALGEEARADLSTRFKNKMYNMVVNDVKNNGITNANRKLASTIGAEFDEDTNKIMAKAISKANDMYVDVQSRKQEAVMSKMKEITADPEMAQQFAPSSKTYIEQYLSTPANPKIGQTPEFKMSQAAKIAGDFISIGLTTSIADVNDSDVIDAEINKSIDGMKLNESTKATLKEQVSSYVYKKLGKARAQAKNGDASLYVQMDPEINRLFKEEKFGEAIARAEALYDSSDAPTGARTYSFPQFQKTMKEINKGWITQPDNYYAAITESAISKVGPMWDKVANDLAIAKAIPPATILFDKLPKEDGQYLGSAIAEYESDLKSDTIKTRTGKSVADFEETVRKELLGSDIKLPVGARRGSYNPTYAQGISDSVVALAYRALSEGKADDAASAASIGIQRFNNMFSTIPTNGGKDAVLLSKMVMRQNGVTDKVASNVVSSPEKFIHYAELHDMPINYDHVANMLAKSSDVSVSAASKAADQIALQSKTDPEGARKAFTETFGSMLKVKNTSRSSNGLSMYMQLGDEDFPLKFGNSEAAFGIDELPDISYATEEAALVKELNQYQATYDLVRSKKDMNQLSYEVSLKTQLDKLQQKLKRLRERGE